MLLSASIIKTVSNYCFKKEKKYTTEQALLINIIFINKLKR